MDVQVKKDEKASGYEIQISADKKFVGKCITVKLEGYKNTEMQIKNAGLKSGTKYYVRVRSYKMISSDPCYGAYSNTVKVNVK